MPANALRIAANVTFGDLALLLAGGLLVAIWLLRGHPRGSIPAAVPVSVGLLLVAGILSILVADNSDSIVPTLRFTITLGCMPLIVMLAASTPLRLERIVDAWLLGTAANAAVGALDLLGVTSIGLALTGVDWLGFTGRVAGLTLHPNDLGLVAALALPVAVSRLAMGGARGGAALAIAPILVGGVAISGSRGALVAAVAGVVLYFVLGATPGRRRAFALLSVTLVAATLGLVAAPGDNASLDAVAIERLTGAGDAAASDAVRRETYRTAIDEVLSDPFLGQGFAAVRQAHNIYLQLLQAGGVIALTGFLVFAAGILGRARRLARQSGETPPWFAALAAGAGAGVGVWLLNGMVGTAIYDRYLYVPAGIILALGLVRESATDSMRCGRASDRSTSRNCRSGDHAHEPISKAR